MNHKAKLAYVIAGHANALQTKSQRTCGEQIPVMASQPLSSVSFCSPGASFWERGGQIKVRPSYSLGLSEPSMLYSQRWTYQRARGTKVLS